MAKQYRKQVGAELCQAQALASYPQASAQASYPLAFGYLSYAEAIYSAQLYLL